MEYDPSTNTSTLSSLPQGEGIKVRGTKGLMEGLRDILGTEIEDVKIDETNENSIVNARRKEELAITRNDIEISDENSLEIDEDLFNQFVLWLKNQNQKVITGPREELKNFFGRWKKKV